MVDRLQIVGAHDAHADTVLGLGKNHAQDVRTLQIQWNSLSEGVLDGIF